MIEQGTQEWHQLRRGKVTAFKVADVLAKGRGNAESLTRAKYMSQLVTERLTSNAIESFTNEAMQRGTEMEPVARAAYSAASNNHVEQIAFVDHPTIAMAGASPDGLVWDDGLIEIKSPNSSTHIEYILKGVVPEKYKPQMAFQMACTGRQWCDFISYDDRLIDTSKHLFIVRYERDQAYIDEIEEAVKKFLAEVDANVQEFLNK